MLGEVLPEPLSEPLLEEGLDGDDGTEELELGELELLLGLLLEELELEPPSVEQPPEQPAKPRVIRRQIAISIAKVLLLFMVQSPVLRKNLTTGKPPRRAGMLRS